MNTNTNNMNPDTNSLTPLMKQYWEIKSLHEDKILLFRMGDFFEMFYDDAIKAAPILDIALTQRNKKSADETPMCGVPFHSIAAHINKLLSKGYKVAICDQVEDPKLAKGLVKRAVTRILTPGVVFDSDTLDHTLSHYIASFDEDSFSLVDVTTGESFYYLEQKNFELLQILPVAEVVLSQNYYDQLSSQQKKTLSHYTLSFFEITSETTPQMDLQKSALRLTQYIQSLSTLAKIVLRPFEKRSLKKRLELGPLVLKHLEVFVDNKGDYQGSFYHAINRTKTSSGARLLRQWLSFPLTDLHTISERQDLVEVFIKDLGALKKTRHILSGVGDIERRLGKISLATSHGRDFISLSESLKSTLSALESQRKVIESAKGFNPDLFEIQKSLNNLCVKIDQTLVEDPPLTVRQGYLIRHGFSKELDELIELATNSQNLLLKMEAQERERTQISSLKIRYNNVFGFYIEITNVHKDKIPAHYKRKQTLANAERYCTDELIELERKILSAQTKRNDLEYEIFENLRKEVLSQSQLLLQVAGECALLDVLTSLAWLAIEEKYVKPRLGGEFNLQIVDSRHPVVEQNVKKDFIANTIELSGGASKDVLLLTGPNMAGKSTLMRQMALTIILAQMGSFVPARSCDLPIYDAIFTRIGASDQLSEGLSTFMVEMTETSHVLKNATSKSFIVLDEIGRGTSTYDGLALAQAILEYIIKNIKSHVVFATHYHELTRLENVYPQIKNAHMTVSERGGEIRFLHTLKPGAAGRSYGIQVAELAGLPKELTVKAKSLLLQLESQKSQGQESLFQWTEPFDMATDLMTEEQNEVHVSVNDPEIEASKFKEINKIAKSIQETSISTLTPLEALNKIASWQKELSNLKDQGNLLVN